MYGDYIMFYALDESGYRVHISRANSTKNYFCPACHFPVNLRRGKLKAHHFYHKSSECCDPWYHTNMSQWHLDMQNLFPEECREVIVHSKDKTEFHIADVLLETKRNHYVFEFQHSHISVQDFLERSSFYINLGYSLVWVFDLRDSSSGKTPKCLYYEDLDYQTHYKHVIWPGRDRLKLFDFPDVLSFLEECQNENINISILFHTYTGRGKQFVNYYPSGFEHIKWEYVDPIHREEYFIRPDFDRACQLSSFYAAFFSKNDFNEHIKQLLR